MKRTLLITLLLTSVSAFAFMGSHHGKMGMMMFDELNLTKAQRAELRTIRKEARDEQLTLMEKVEALHEKTHEKIMAVLNKEQQKKFRELRKEMRPRHGSGPCGCHGKMGMKKPYCDK